MTVIRLAFAPDCGPPEEECDMHGWCRSNYAIQAYAKAEWDALDQDGRLPVGWVNPMPWPFDPDRDPARRGGA